MKFSCNKCHAKYAIADEKVRGKVLKIRCKKCQAIIVVREIKVADPKTQSPTSAPSRAKVLPASSPRRDPQNSVAVAAAAQRKKSPPQASAGPQAKLRNDGEWNEATRVTSADEISSLLASLGGQKSAKAPAKAAPPAAVQWFVAVNGEQSPAMRREELDEKIRQGVYNAKAYLWNKTMSGWVRLAKLPEFAELLRQGEKVSAKAAPPTKSSPKPKARAKAPASAADKLRAQDPAERRKEQPTRAVEALDKIAEIVRESTSPHAALQAQPARSVEAPTKKIPTSAPAVAESKTARATSELAISDAAKAVAAPKEEIEDLFFDPASIQTFSGQVSIEKDEDPGERAYSGPHNVEGFDPFALVDDDLPPELPRRESTRVFVAAAGLKNRARKQKIYAAIGASVGLLLIGTIAADAIGWIEIPLLHGYVQSVKIAAVGGKKTKTEPVLPVEPSIPLTEEEKAAIRHALMVGDSAAVAEVRRKARARAKRMVAANLNLQPGHDIDLSDNVNSGVGQGQGVGSRGAGQATTVNLSEADRLAMQDLVKNTERNQVQVQAKPSVGKIRLPQTFAGGLQAKQIAGVVQEGYRSIQFCANQETKRGLSLPPAVNMAVTIETRGVVSFAQVQDSQQRNSPFGRCLAQKVKNWKFPSFTGQAMEVEIPFKFTTVQ